MQFVAQYLSKTDIGSHVYHSLSNEFKRINAPINDSFYVMTTIACVSIAMQRAYLSPTHCSLNTYNIICAGAAHGKSLYLKEIAKFQTTHHSETVLGTVASASGLRKALERSGSLVWVQDEWATWLSRATKGDDTHALQTLNGLLELWSTPHALGATEASTKDAQTAEVKDPRMSIYGAGVVSTTTAALQAPLVKQSGFTSRLVLWTPGDPFETADRYPLSDAWKRHPYSNGVLSWSSVTEKSFDQTFRHAYSMNIGLGPSNVTYPIWTRAAEHCIRFASLLACAHKRSVVTDEDVDMAHIIVMHSVRSYERIMDGPEYVPSSFPLAVRKLQETLEVLDSREQYSVHHIAMEAPWAAQIPEQLIKRYLKTLASYSLISYDDALEIWTPSQFFGQNVLEVMKHGLV